MDREELFDENKHDEVDFSEEKVHIVEKHAGVVNFTIEIQTSQRKDTKNMSMEEIREDEIRLIRERREILKYNENAFLEEIKYYEENGMSSINENLIKTLNDALDKTKEAIKIGEKYANFTKNLHQISRKIKKIVLNNLEIISNRLDGYINKNNSKKLSTKKVSIYVDNLDSVKSEMQNIYNNNMQEGDKFLKKYDEFKICLEKIETAREDRRMRINILKDLSKIRT